MVKEKMDSPQSSDKALAAQAPHSRQPELERERDRLRLVLDLTNRITSNLGLRDVLRAISANIREVVQGDAVGISLLDAPSGNVRTFAVDFPHGKGVIREELVIKLAGPGKEVLDTLRPIVVGMSEHDKYGPDEAYDMVASEGLKAHCLIPLVNRGRALGLLWISRTIEDSFTPEDVNFLSQASGQIAIAVENALAYQEISELNDKLAQEKLYLEEEIRGEFEGIIGQSPALRQMLKLVETVATSDSTVLLLGETGTGKELVARAIHDRSRRKERTLVKLNCAAIPSGLLESELFGHERGAFTGAIMQKIGRLELADQGTLFLDEVGDIPLELQPKLLRALQEGEFERLGSTRTKKVDVRLIAATNRDLDQMIEQKQFRSDLYYRLNVFPIRVPPLRERPEDIPLLVQYFSQKYARRMQKRIENIPAAALRKLTRCHWPGNVRELQNVVERAVILTRSSTLAISVPELEKGGAALPPARAGDFDEQDRIVQVLKETKGRVGGPKGAAARLGLKRTTLISRMKKMGIDLRKLS